MFCIPQGGGIKEYIVNLTNSLAVVDVSNEYILYVLEDQYDYAIKQLPSRFNIKIIPYKNRLISRICRSLFSQKFWSKEEIIESFDVFHSPFYYAPKFKRAKLIITVHDLRLYRYPKTYDFLRYNFLKNSVRETIQRADRIISISQFTKDEIIDTCHISEDNITVIHEAINRMNFSVDRIGSYSIPIEYDFLNHSRFLFSVSHIEPRKNYERLIKAFAKMKLKKEYSDVKLVIAGRKNLKAKPVMKLIDETKDVIYLDFIPREFLLWLYHNATLFVFPSYYEGFGFPPMEAACLKTVSAVSNVSSIPEVCGETAFYFNPYEVDEICNVVSCALNHPEKIEKKKALLEKQLSKFSWEKNARRTIEIYESCLRFSRN